MTTERFIKKTIIRIIVIVLISIFVFSFMDAANTIVSNYISMGQMENSDGMFILMEMYKTAIRPTISYILTFVIGYNVGTIIYDTFKFIKNKRNGENENEKD